MPKLKPLLYKRSTYLQWLCRRCLACYGGTGSDAQHSGAMQGIGKKKPPESKSEGVVDITTKKLCKCRPTAFKVQKQEEPIIIQLWLHT